MTLAAVVEGQSASASREVRRQQRSRLVRHRWQQQHVEGRRRRLEHVVQCVADHASRGDHDAVAHARRGAADAVDGAVDEHLLGAVRLKPLDGDAQLRQCRRAADLDLDRAPAPATTLTSGTSISLTPAMPSRRSVARSVVSVVCSSMCCWMSSAMASAAARARSTSAPFKRSASFTASPSFRQGETTSDCRDSPGSEARPLTTSKTGTRSPTAPATASKKTLG